MTRVRNNSFTKSSTGHGSQYDSGGGLIYGPVAYPVSVEEEDVMTDVVTPGYSRRSAKGDVIISPMSKTRVSRSFMALNRNIVRSDGISAVYTGDWDRLGGYNPLSSESTELILSKDAGLVITDAYAKVGSPDVAVLTELVELKETLGFLASPVKGMVTLTRRFKDHLRRVTDIENRNATKVAKWEKLPARSPKKRSKPTLEKLPVFSVGRFKGSDVSSAWLAYRYGLMPLIYTFQDVEKLLKKRLEGSPPRATARAKKVTTVNVDDSTSEYYSWGPATGLVTTTKQGTIQITSRGGVLYVPDFSLSAQLGIQWNRVPAALYEGVPLSFVTDWFHNGSALYDALTAEFRAQKILGAWVTQTVEASVILTEVETAVTNCSVSGGTSYQTFSGKRKQRRAASVSDVEFHFRMELNGKRVADGLALIHTFLATARKK